MKLGMGWDSEQRYVGQAMTGYAFPGVEIRVVDANDNDVPRDGQSSAKSSRGVMALWRVLAPARRFRRSAARWLVPHRRGAHGRTREARPPWQWHSALRPPAALGTSPIFHLERESPGRPGRRDEQGWLLEFKGEIFSPR